MDLEKIVQSTMCIKNLIFVESFQRSGLDESANPCLQAYQMSTSFDLVLFFDNLLVETSCNLDEFSDSFHPQTRSADERFKDFKQMVYSHMQKKRKKTPGN